MDQHTDVVVIGAGPAGLSAALMLGRARRAVIVVDAGSPRNRFAAHMQGVLGFDGVPPAELRARGVDELARYGGAVLAQTVARVSADDRGIGVHLGDGSTIRARALVVATGIADELPDVPGLAERWGRTVLHCPYCHGWEVRDRTIGVLTTSPLSAHQATLVRQWSDDVVVFTAGLGPMDAASRRRLEARGVRLVDAPVTAVVGEGEAISAVITADGTETAVDAIFTAGAARPLDAFLADLALERTVGPMGDLLAVDERGRTSHPRIWAVGNVVNPAANVPMSMGAGSLAGAAVNAALVEEDVDDALTPTAYWERRYGDRERMWSGRVNQAVAELAAALPPGRALDLGCGEGGDALWLASRGWSVTGVDISETAVARARAAADEQGIDASRVRFIAAELPEGIPDVEADLVTASFLHSPVELARTRILAAAASRVAPGGHLLVVSHAAPPPWAHADAHDAHFPAVEDELAELALDPDVWEVVIAEVRPRLTTAPDGSPAEIDDAVILVRRRG